MTTTHDEALPTTVSVVIVDGHDLVREGLAQRIETVANFEVIGEAGTIMAAKQQIANLRPDVVVLDVELSDGSGLELCPKIESISPGTQCVIHTGSPISGPDIRRANASAVVLKELTGDKLIQAIQRVASFQLSQ